MIELIHGLPKEWHNLTPTGPVRTWTRNSHAPSPYKASLAKAPVRRLEPFLDNTSALKVDIAHTYAIAGYGKDECASALVLLAVHCGVFGWCHGYQEQLDHAYAFFREWCRENHKTTTILDFSKETLKIKSLLNI